MKIEDIDHRFKPALVGERKVNYFNAVLPPFTLEGIPWGNPREGRFFRLPDDMKAPEEVNDGALWNARNQTAGGVVRFRTDATFISVRAKLHCPGDMNHMPRAGSAGFDLYAGSPSVSHHVGTAQPGRDETDLERVLIDFPYWKGEMRDYILNLPLYGGVETVEIGIPPEAMVESATPHRNGPVLFYGSSITQGGCASRPGNSYAAMLSRALDFEQINLGFSGCGRGEAKVAEAIASLDLAAFVMDYDYNAPDAEHLKNTHEPFYRIIRAHRPHLPIVMLSKCSIWPDRRYETDSVRREIIRETYAKGIKEGDKHLYFIDGETLFGTHDREACCVDCCHPNDLGFYRMFETVLPVLARALREA